MLTVEGRNQFAGVKIGERDYLYFGKAESFFGGWTHRPQFNRMDRSSKYRSDLNFDLCGSVANNNPGSVGSCIFSDCAPWDRFANALSDAGER